MPGTPFASKKNLLRWVIVAGQMPFRVIMLVKPRLARFAVRPSGLASGPALAVRPAGSAEVSSAQGWVPKIVSAKRLETIFGCP
jgi:hypothetical protein